MTQPHIQTSFASGEWAPKLRSRVDIQKYHNGAALLRNFFVDYSGGGASTRQGTKFINQCKAAGARLIPFQPSTTLSYVLEFGQNYIRFYSNGSPILEAATTISGATQANPGVITDTGHGYVTGDWVFISDVVGMTQLNGNYYIVVRLSANTYSLTDLNGNAINTTGYGAYVSGGTAQRVYTLASPYNISDLFPNPLSGNPGIKFVQDVTSLIICHPSYQPNILTINSAASWILTTIAFQPTISPPTNLTDTGTTLSTGGSWNYNFVVTSVDVNGQESVPTAPLVFNNYDFIGTTGGSLVVNWTAATGAVSYNIYMASPAFSFTIPAGAQYGFVGNVSGVSFSFNYPNAAPDMSQTPPISQNPFLGTGVISYTVTASGAYTTVPSVVVDSPSSGVVATAQPSLGATIIAINGHAGGNLDITAPAGVSPVGNCTLFGGNAFGAVFGITSATLISLNTWEITGLSIIAPGSLAIPGANTSANPLSLGNATLAVTPNTFTLAAGFSINVTYGVISLLPIQEGSGYTTIPNVTFSAGAATATAVLGKASAGNPSVPGFLQERLMLANQPKAVQTYNLSQPGSFFNFNISNPSEDDDAISGTIIAEELNDIRNLTPVPTGMIAFTGKGAWLINGGGGISTQTPITPSNQTAQPQGFNGANDMKPIKINMDALYVTNKGNYVRDLTYNLYAQIFTGSDISAIANHLFFGRYMFDWAWSEEPFKVLWAIRDDGQMLSLTFVKEQEVQGWTHHDTNGQFKSVCSVIENVNGNIVDAVYLIVQRLVNGNTVQYVERMADRYFTYGYEDAWSVDCALQTTPASSPTGALVISGNASAVGNSVTLTDTADAPFTSTMVTNSWIVRAGGGIYKITAFTSSSAVTAQVLRVPLLINPYTNAAYNVTIGYTIWQPTSSVSGLTQLIGQSVVGVADGAVVGPFVVSGTGSVALGVTATKVTLGLVYLPQLQTLPLEPASQKGTTQSKRKKFPDIVLRVADTLGLQVGTSFANAVAMKDFQIGAIPSQSTGPGQVVTDLVNPSSSPTGNVTDGFTVNDPLWQEIGQLCIQQNLPYPATILGIIPTVVVGDE